MAGLKDNQLAVIRTLIDTAPDSAIRSLDMALSSEPDGDTAMSRIRDMVSVEAASRRARSWVFGPVLALCPRSAPLFAHQTFPPRLPALLWRALEETAPGKRRAVLAACETWSQDNETPAVLDELCLLAAAGLRNAAGTPFAAAAALAENAEPNGAALLAAYFDLTPLARSGLSKLPDWLSRMTDERAAAVRLMFKDATSISADASPKVFEMLAAQLAEPWQILRIVSAVVETPTDTLLAGSELAFLGERLMNQVDARIGELSGFDPQGGAPAGTKAAVAVSIAVNTIAEMDQSVNIKRDGPWGQRLTKQKQLLSQKVESVLKKTDDIVGMALPLKPGRVGKMARGFPNYKHAPNGAAIAKAEGVLAFCNHIRAAAQTGGFAALRNKVIEKLDERIDRYVEDVLDHLRAPEAEDAEIARAYLDVAATLVGLYQDEKAAQIVRRRAAA